MKTSIKITLMALALFVAMPTTTSFAQSTQKQLKKELRKKADRDSRKEAKRMSKEGWKSMPGKLPLAKQLQQAKYAELSVDEDGNKEYFIGAHKALGGNYTAAKQIADTRAHLELAQSIQNSLIAQKEDKIAQADLGEEDIELVNDYMSTSKSVVSAKLRGVTPVVEIYRQSDKNCEVMVVVKISAKAAKDAVRDELRKEMQQKTQKLADEIKVE